MLIYALSRVPVVRWDRKTRLYRRQAALDLDPKVSRVSTFDLSIPTYASARSSGSWMGWWVSLLTSSAPLFNDSLPPLDLS